MHEEHRITQEERLISLNATGSQQLGAVFFKRSPANGIALLLDGFVVSKALVTEQWRLCPVRVCVFVDSSRRVGQ